MYLGPIWRILVGMHTGERWKLGHRPGLDGLRAIAVLMVVVAHFDRGEFTAAGVIGVTVFFTLSGFLITTLLLDETRRTGRVSLGGFYRRRALRLFPALAVMLLAVSLLTVVGAPTDVTGGMVASVVGYVSNWFLLGTAHGGVIQWGALGHTWSLAIEEQFYVLWPLVVIAATRRGRRAVFNVAASGATLSLVWGLVSGRSNLASDVSAYPLLAGCALAAWMAGREALRPPGWLTGLALVPLVPLVVLDPPRELQQAVVPLLTVTAIWVVVQTPVRWLTVRPLSWVGRRSYGLYLWHVPIAYLWAHLAAPYPVVVVTGVGLAFGLTALSWRYVETPFLRLKDRQAARASVRRPPVAEDVATVVGAVDGREPVATPVAVNRV